MYAVQLLPDAEEARIIRDALDYYKNNRPLSTAEEDTCWKYVSQISIALRKER
jgi:hypothetical protein